ncbi:MAG: hypothetical protein SVT52_07455 [Planctomycetota bacterium]|nr:hypothetical protein [Planctomycetota bacterium]
MKMHVSRQARIRFLSVFGLFVLVAGTIYVSAASRQGSPAEVQAMDVADPAQAREALLFNPYETDQAAQAAAGVDAPIKDIAPSGADRPVVDENVGIASDSGNVQLALAEPSGTAGTATPTIPNDAIGLEGNKLPHASLLVSKSNGTGSTGRGAANGGKKGLLSSKLFWLGVAGAGIAAGISIPLALNDSGGSSHSAAPRSPAVP